MVGPGGTMRVPASEGAVLMRVIRQLEGVLERGTVDPGSRGVIRQAIDRLAQLGYQVSRGYHRNPVGVSRRLFVRGERGERVALIGDAVDAIYYRHATDQQSYVHEFERPEQVRLWARELPAFSGETWRDLVIAHVRHEPLWDDF